MTTMVNSVHVTGTCTRILDPSLTFLYYDVLECIINDFIGTEKLTYSILV